MKKTKDILIFTFAIVIISAIGFIIFTLNDIQNKYSEEAIEKKRVSTDSRFLYGVGSDSLKFRTEFVVTKIMMDSLTEYEYKSKTDSTRNLKITYHNYTQKLYFDLTEYKILERKVIYDQQNTEIWFDSYETTEPIIDGMSPLIFNQDFGILALAGPLNPPIFFMDRKSDKAYAERITKILRK